MKILGISGSLRARSSNTALLRALAQLAPEGVEITLSTPLDRLPHFNPDLEEPNPPPSVQDWRAELESSDGVYICSPEYAFGIPGVLKNALDWDVSSGKLYRKPVALINASPNHGGAMKAQASLVQTLTAMSANLVDRAFVSVTGVYKKLDDQGLTDPDTVQALKHSLQEFVAAIEAVRASRAQPGAAADAATERPRG